VIILKHKSTIPWILSNASPEERQAYEEKRDKYNETCNRNKKIKRILKTTLGHAVDIAFGIAIGLIVAYLIFKFGWNN